MHVRFWGCSAKGVIIDGDILWFDDVRYYIVTSLIYTFTVHELFRADPLTFGTCKRPKANMLAMY